MNRAGMRGAALLALLLAVGCSRGGGRPLSSSPAPTTTSTLAPTTATLSPEEAVKAAYLAYWAMVDKAFADPTQPDGLEAVATEPLLSFVRDDLALYAARGETYVTPPDRQSSHRIDDITISEGTGSLSDCFVDARVKYSRDGVVLDDATVSKSTSATLQLVDRRWVVSDLTVDMKTNGADRCAA